MKKIFTVLFLLCLTSNAFAQLASNDWHGNWRFQNPQERANVLQEAMAMKFVEEGGLTNNYYQQQDCNTDGACRNGSSSTVSIGSNVTVTGDGNVVTATNDGSVTAQTNNGKGAVANGKKAFVDLSDGLTDNSSQTDTQTFANNLGNGSQNVGDGSSSNSENNTSTTGGTNGPLP